MGFITWYYHKIRHNKLMRTINKYIVLTDLKVSLQIGPLSQIKWRQEWSCLTSNNI